MHDIVIRGGTVVDGTGSAPRKADVAVDGDRIAAVGSDVGEGRREIDARGQIVTPGWVDIHTHYDGQVTWDTHLTPSGWNGVTTVVMGNCGVGFAPVRPGQRDFLIQLMEGVEDIPGTALAEGIRWGWETFAEYLDAIEKMPRAIDVGAQVPHGAVRAYVMGERGAKNEKATRGRHRGDGEHRQGSAAGRGARLLDVAHDSAPRQGRRAGAGDDGQRRRAAGDRSDARRGRTRRLPGRERPDAGRRRAGLDEEAVA